MVHPYLKTFPVTADYTRLAAARAVVDCTIQAPPTNAADVTFKGIDGQPVLFAPGQYQDFRNVNLNDFEVRGTPGDVLEIIGTL